MGEKTWKKISCENRMHDKNEAEACHVFGIKIGKSSWKLNPNWMFSEPRNLYVMISWRFLAPLCFWQGLCKINPMKMCVWTHSPWAFFASFACLALCRLRRWFCVVLPCHTIPWTAISWAVECKPSSLIRLTKSWESF